MIADKQKVNVLVQPYEYDEYYNTKSKIKFRIV